jgi:hypothetical protein
MFWSLTSVVPLVKEALQKVQLPFAVCLLLVRILP